MVALADIRKTWSLGGKYNREEPKSNRAEPKSNRAEPKSNRAEPDPLLAIIFHPLAIVLCGLNFRSRFTRTRLCLVHISQS